MSDRAKDIVTVTMFIGWHDGDALWGGYRASEAIRAFARLVGIPVIRLEEVIRNENRTNDGTEESK